MASPIAQYFDSIPTGTEILISNSGVGGTPISGGTRGTGTTIQAVDTPTFLGSRAMRVAQAAASAGYLLWNFAVSGQTRFVTRFYFQLKTGDDCNNTSLFEMRSASAPFLYLTITAAGNLRFTGATGAQILTELSLSSITRDTWYRVEISTQKGVGAADGIVQAQIFQGQSTTPIYDQSSSAATLGTADMAGMRLGSSGTSNAAHFKYYDEFAMKELSSGMLGPSTGLARKIRKGPTELTAIRLGDTAVDRIYNGETLVYSRP